MLFDASRHEPIIKKAWNQDIVQDEISSIINDIERSVLPDACCWPTHPLDAESYPRVGPKWTAYAGAAGAIHGLQILGQYGYKVNDLSDLLEPVYQSFLKSYVNFACICLHDICLYGPVRNYCHITIKLCLFKVT